MRQALDNSLFSSFFFFILGMHLPLWVLLISFSWIPNVRWKLNQTISCWRLGLIINNLILNVICRLTCCTYLIFLDFLHFLFILIWENLLNKLTLVLFSLNFKNFWDFIIKWWDLRFRNSFCHHNWLLFWFIFTK